MRTLIQLLIRNHRLVLFVMLEIIAINWVVSTHAHPRGSIAKIGLEISSSWTDAVGRLIFYKDLKNNNSNLLIENARLRTDNMSLQEVARSSSSSLDNFKSPWISVPAEIIRTSSSFNNNVLVANRGKNSGLSAGLGMLDNGVVAGFISEVSDNHSLVLPIIHLSTTWSVRLGENGAIGILSWSGEDTRYATLSDIPLSANILPGDSVISSGFQGTFPPGVFVGSVEELIVTSADKFQSIQIKLAADFKRIHYVEFLINVNESEIDSLVNNMPL